MSHSEFHEELRHNVKEPLLPVEKEADRLELWPWRRPAAHSDL
jgi:hypothetical protein